MYNGLSQVYCMEPEVIIISIQRADSDFIWPFLLPYMGVIPNPNVAFIFQISCILVIIFPIFMIYFIKGSRLVLSPTPAIVGTGHQ